MPAPIDDAWAAFNDLERIAPCFPGASLTSYDGEAFEGLCKVKLGPISLQYTGTGRFVSRDEAAHTAVIEAKGKDKRGNGTAAANVTATLVSAGDDATDVTVKTDLNITGKPAQFGRGVMQDVSDKLLGQFASCLETKLGADTADEPPVLTRPTSRQRRRPRLLSRRPRSPPRRPLRRSRPPPSRAGPRRPRPRGRARPRCDGAAGADQAVCRPGDRRHHRALDPAQDLVPRLAPGHTPSTCGKTVASYPREPSVFPQLRQRMATPRFQWP